MTTPTMEHTAKRRRLVNWLLILMVACLTIIPLLVVKNAEFGGADGQAESVINKINAGYRPWFTPLFEPASGEIESLLFALQAAIGAGVIGYGLGYLRARHKN
jgi:cobalt/nickel transport protein